jgi:hypothetical protein
MRQRGNCQAGLGFCHITNSGTLHEQRFETSRQEKGQLVACLSC